MRIALSGLWAPDFRKLPNNRSTYFTSFKSFYFMLIIWFSLLGLKCDLFYLFHVICLKQLCICNTKINQLRKPVIDLLKFLFTGKMMYLVTLSVVSRLKVPLQFFPYWQPPNFTRPKSMRKFIAVWQHDPMKTVCDQASHAFNLYKRKL